MSLSIVVTMFEDETPVAWIAMPPRATVVSADGSEIGVVESVLGDKDEDIFHGIVLRRREGGKRVEVPAGRIKKITNKHVVTDLTEDDIAALHTT
jgi:hypothetical protein